MHKAGIPTDVLHLIQASGRVVGETLLVVASLEESLELQATRPKHNRMGNVKCLVKYWHIFCSLIIELVLIGLKLLANIKLKTKRLSI